MSDIRAWISEFRNLSGVGLIDAKAAYDANPGKTPGEVWAACGGKVPKQIATLEAENADLRAHAARLEELLDEALALLREAECGILNAWDREKDAKPEPQPRGEVASASAPKCSKCGGAGWCYGNELDSPSEETAMDTMTHYLCDRCGSGGIEPEAKP